MTLTGVVEKGPIAGAERIGTVQHARRHGRDPIELLDTRRAQDVYEFHLSKAEAGDGTGDGFPFVIVPGRRDVSRVCFLFLL